jgi:hypothetical protein
MKRNISRYQRLTDRGSIPKEKSPFSIDVKGGEKNRGMERKRRSMKTRGVQHEHDCLTFLSGVFKCFHQFQRGGLLKY